MALNLVPQANQSLGQTQNPILTNFTVINTTYSTDHVTFNALSNQGFHNKVTFVEQTTLPIAVSDPNILMYSANDATTGQPEIYLKRNSDGTALGLPITEKVVTGGGQTGYTYLPSGVIAQWGIATSAPPNTTVVVTFTKPFTSATSYSITWSADQNGANVGVILKLTAKSATQATFLVVGLVPTGSPSNQVLLNYFAIGV